MHKLLKPFLLPVIIFGIQSNLQAADFAPTTAAQLQADLTTAAASSEDDTITLAASTTYNASDVGAAFTYTTGNSGALTITGAGVGSSILSGGAAFQPMTIVSNATLVTISGITFDNGLASGANTGGAFYANGQSFDVQNCAFTNSTNSGSGNAGGLYIYASTGNITFSNNLVDQNDLSGSGDVGGVFLETGAGGVVTAEENTVTGNTSATSNGGIRIATSGNVVFNNNTISDNTSISSTGGLNITGAEISADGNTISDNQVSAGVRGGVYITGSSSLTFTNNTVTNNESSGDNGGAYITGATLNVSTNTFSGNSTTGAADYAGVTVLGTGAVVFADNLVSSNAALGQIGGASISSSSGALTITGNTFRENTAVSDYGGLYAAAATDITLQDNSFISNSSQTLYGGAYLINTVGNIAVVNNLIVGNTATANGFGGIYINDSSTGTPTTLNLVNNTIYNNTSTGASFAGLGVSAPDSSITVNISNNILYGNTNNGTSGQGEDAYILNTSSDLNVFNNDIGEICFAAPASCDLTSLGADAGDNLVSENPLFIDASTGNYRLQATSTLIDRGLLTAPGLPSTDIVGNPRSFLTIPDIGAYEAVAEVLSSSTTLDFGSVAINNENSIVITLSNNGTYDLNVSALTLSDTTNFAVQTDAGSSPCGASSFSIASGESCTLGVEFAPDAEQTFSETLTIVSDAPANPSYAIALTGVGTAAGANGGCSLQSSGSNALVWILTLLPLIGMMRLRRRSH